jgi:T5SS/PEP-CTERM-associated repeat protein
VTVGNSGRGSVTQTGGTTTISGTNSLFLGNNAGSVGSYSLGGTGSLSVTGNENIGLSGTGSFTQSGGSNSLTLDMVVGFTSGALGTYTMNGGTFTTGGTQYIGYSATGSGGQSGGTFNHSGGMNTVSSGLYLGYNAGATGAYNLSGAAVLESQQSEFIGLSGTGTFTQTGGTNFVGLHLFIGYFSNSTGRYEQTGGTFQSNGNVVIADYGGGELIVDGPTTTFTSGGYLTLAFFDGTGSLVISDGGTVRTLGVFGAEIGRNTGTADVTVDGPGSRWEITTELDFGTGTVDIQNQGSLSVGTELRVLGLATLNIQNQGVVSADSLVINNGTVNLQGGTLRVNTIAGTGGLSRLSYLSGTIQLAGNRTIGTDATISTLFGASPTIPTGKELTIEGTANLLTSLKIDGGSFTAPSITGGQNMDLQRGTLNLTNQAVTIGTGGLLGSALDVNEDMTVNVTLGITNQGLVTGDGQIGGTFANASTGELRAQAGRSLQLTGSGNTNAGQIKLLGGELEFTQNLTNSAGAFISGNGSLIVGGGLVNQGTMNFAGTANIDGAVTNAAGGKIISGGGGATVFYDDVTNNGEIRTSTNGFTVFFGSASGSGTFTGTGTVNFEGDLSPGSSPATVSFGGDVTLGPEARLIIEIGGTTPGTYDQINVAGQLSLDGTLAISLINGFVPAAGQTFDFLVGSDVVGAFSSIELPTLNGLAWNTSQLLAGVISVSTGLAGDYNDDGKVDASDYTRWRNNLGSLTSLPNDDTAGVGPDDYDRWKAHFGEMAGSGSGTTGSASANAAVPEPTSMALLLTAAIVSVVTRFRRPARLSFC